MKEERPEDWEATEFEERFRMELTLLYCDALSSKCVLKKGSNTVNTCPTCRKKSDVMVMDSICSHETDEGITEVTKPAAVIQTIIPSGCMLVW